MFLPVSLFSGFAPTDFFTLYSQFGTHDNANDGFEEWAHSDQPIPTPGAVALLGVAGLFAGRRRR